MHGFLVVSAVQWFGRACASIAVVFHPGVPPASPLLFAYPARPHRFPLDAPLLRRRGGLSSSSPAAPAPTPALGRSSPLRPPPPPPSYPLALVARVPSRHRRCCVTPATRHRSCRRRPPARPLARHSLATRAPQLRSYSCHRHRRDRGPFGDRAGAPTHPKHHARRHT